MRLAGVSLRTRLVAGVLVLAAVGLVLLAGITYAEQRTFLYDRIDQQARSAMPLASVQLSRAGYDASSATTTPTFPPPFRGYGGQAYPGGPGAGAGGDGDGDRGGQANLPPGTFAQRRETSGKVVGSVSFPSYGEASLPAPDLPADLHSGLSTVDAKGSSDLRYRVLSGTFNGQPTIVAIPLRETGQTLHRLLLVEGLVIAGVLLALALASWWLVRLGLRPLDRIGQTAGAIAAGDLSRRVGPADRRTEVGRLGLSLNAMLGRLEEAFAKRQASEDRLRTFLADASHELRTPLASIRGYAELFRIGAARSPADTEKAMSRIEQEAARMGVLVEDLLTLARLDEVPTLDAREVDLAALTADAAHDARAMAPDRVVSLHAAGPVTVAGDPGQLRQVLANLVRNALVHTPDGTPIELSVARSEDVVLLAVRDHGPGLPGGDPDAVFGRFWRAAGPARGRGPAGAGLGLAIVAGIISAHHGEVHAADAPDGGAVFTVRLAAGAAAASRPRAAGAADSQPALSPEGDAVASLTSSSPSRREP